jgi:tetratricopeptide (TPR) repeat protein
MKEKVLKYVSEAIMTYGNPTIKAEFQSLDRQNPVRHQILVALATTIRDNIVHSTAFDMIDKNRPFKKIRNKKCPIYKALVEMVEITPTCSLLNDDDIIELQESVSQWGRPLLHPFWTKLMLEEEVRQFTCAKQVEGRSISGSTGTSDGDGASSSAVSAPNMYFTSRSVVKHGSSLSAENGTLDWSKFQKITISDLKLFESCKGCVLEGTLVTDSFTPIVGTSTLLEDERGNVIKITLYNFLPSGVSGDDANALGKQMLPKGSRVKIAEPFYKIFRDGSRGIRVDDPNEIQVICSPKSKQQPTSHKNNIGKGDSREHQEEILLHGKQEANRLFEKKLYFAASESYIQLLRGDDGFISTLLSNRAQASIQLGEWTEALCDAAASLTLQPNFKKSWKRYWKAMLELGITQSDETQSCMCQDHEKLRNVLLLIFSSVCRDEQDHGKIMEQDILQSNGSTAEELKVKGNDAFKAGDYDKARQFYSLALQLAGGTTHAILSNWSQCAMNLNTWHDAIAASAASLRIFSQKKSVCRLAKSLILIGEPRVSVAVLEKFSDTFKKTDRLFRKLVSDANVLSSNNYCIEKGLHNCPDLLSNWVGKIETFQTEGKGRGVRALDDIPPGQVVLVERPIISYHLEMKGDFVASSVGVAEYDDGSHALIKAAAVNRARRDGVFSSIINRLYDGSSVPPLVPFHDLFLTISSANLLLPSHHEYLPGKRINMTPDRISEIINRNSHGIGGLDGANKRYFQHDAELGYSELYPGTSMFNHSTNPNCEYTKIRDKPYQCIMTYQAVRKGEELTVRYHSDEDVVNRCWLQP